MSAILSAPSVAGQASRVAAAAAANRTSLTPEDRLALSRERLRRALQGESDPQRETGRDAARGPLTAAIDGIKAMIPGAGILADTLRGWWEEQPLRLAGKLAFDAATAGVRPVARRNPLGLIAVAFLLGGVIAWSRPWKWMLSSTMFAALTSQLVRKGATRVPIGSWLDVVLWVLRREDENAAAPGGRPGSKGRKRQD